jgi:hypothetical protein
VFVAYELPSQSSRDADAADDTLRCHRSEFINELYEQRGIGGVVFEQTLALGNGSDGQLACFNQCFDRYKNDTDWFAAIVRIRGPSRPQPAIRRRSNPATKCSVWMNLAYGPD